MKECPSEETLARRLADELGDHQARSIDRHVDDCESCQAVLEDLTSSDDLHEIADEDDSIAATLEHLKKSYAKPSLASESEVQMTWPPPPGNAFENSFNQSQKQNTGPWRRGDKIGSYELLEPIGAGSTGWLYKAKDERLSRFVAIKILRDQLASSDSGRERFLREARAAAALQHERIVRVFDVGLSESGNPFLIMEMIEGKTLADLLRSDGPLSARDAASLVLDISEALGAAHKAGLVHRDVKPSNILLERVSGRAKVTDFGLVLSDESDARLTVEGQITGTPAYMSPEQVVKPHDVDARSDVYSLGVLLYEILTGELPFRGAIRMTLSQILHEDPTDIRGLDDRIPIDLATICHKAMSKEPDRRYATAQDMRDDVQRFLDGKPIHARPVSRIETAWKSAKRHPTTTLLTAGLFALLAAIAIGSLVFSASLATARHEAQEKADAADRQRSLAIRTLRALVTEVNSEIEGDVVDYERVQNKLLQTAENGLRSLTSNTDEPNASLYSAEAHHLIGLVRSYLDEPNSALSEQKLAIGQCDELATDPRFRDQAVVLKAKCVAAMAYDDFENEETLLKQSLALISDTQQQGHQSLVLRDATEIEADANHRLALLYSFEGDPNSKEELETQINFLKKSVASYKLLLDMGERNPIVTENYIYCAIACSSAVDSAGRSAEAIEHANGAVQLAKSIVADAPEDWNVNDTLQDAYLQLASLQEPRQAISSYKEAHRIGAFLLDQIEDDTLLAIQLSIEASLHECFRATNDDEAKTWLKSGLATFEQLTSMELYVHGDVGDAMLQLAEAFESIGDNETAKRVADEAVRQLQIALREDRDDPDASMNLMTAFQFQARLDAESRRDVWVTRQRKLLLRIRDRDVMVPNEWLQSQSARLKEKPDE